MGRARACNEIQRQRGKGERKRAKMRARDTCNVNGRVVAAAAATSNNGASDGKWNATQFISAALEIF